MALEILKLRINSARLATSGKIRVTLLIAVVSVSYENLRNSAGVGVDR
jgi:hypothetical protein